MGQKPDAEPEPFWSCLWRCTLLGPTSELCPTSTACLFPGAPLFTSVSGCELPGTGTKLTSQWLASPTPSSNLWRSVVGGSTTAQVSGPQMLAWLPQSPQASSTSALSVSLWSFICLMALELNRGPHAPWEAPILA